MASTVEIAVDERFTQVVTDVVRKHFPDIRQHLPKLVGVVRTKTDKDGNAMTGMRPVVAVKKTPPVYAAMGVAPYLVVIDGCFWQEAPDHEIAGMVGNALLTLDVQTGTKKGKAFVRVKNRKPDMVLFTEAVRMFGAFTPCVIELRAITQGVATAALELVHRMESSARTAEEPVQTEEPQQAEEPPTADESAVERPRRVRRARHGSTPALSAENDSDPDERPRVRSAAEIAEEDAT